MSTFTTVLFCSLMGTVTPYSQFFPSDIYERDRMVAAPPYATALYGKPPPLQLAEPHPRLITANELPQTTVLQRPMIMQQPFQYLQQPPPLPQPQPVFIQQMQQPMAYQMPMYRQPMVYYTSPTAEYDGNTVVQDSGRSRFSPMRGFMKGTLEGILLGSTLGLAG